MTRRGVLASFVFLLCLIIAGGYIHSLETLRNVSFSFKNITTVAIYNATSLDAGKPNIKPLITLHNSGQITKLHPGNYTAHYTGAIDYDSRYVGISVSGQKNQTVALQAQHSSAYLDSKLRSERPLLLATLLSAYPAISNYDVQPGKLYLDGDWYGTTLKYKGSDSFNADSLRVIFQQKNGVWAVVTRPGIVLTTVDYPNIPYSVLHDTNNQ